ncbi:hypothetical protein P3T76_012431 [Phytophthora citrophthora]|uniref:Uncharacterized protein n=1 Tax=Phytophthora citrophthora TaxID=4793 RepID=A0AAD9G4Z9_9STRA|nr:hypothetical protein P3T76_012431 [Phytophthora citrophthora]
MADWDDAALQPALPTQGESTSSASDADQSLRAPATATATGAFGSAEGRTSGVLKLADEDSSTALPNLPDAPCRDRVAIRRTESTKELEQTSLCLELAQLQQALAEEVEDVVHAVDDAAATADGDADTVEYRVIHVDEGTYRGQVQACEQGEWQPHGFGVQTTANGHTCCGQWRNGRQVGHGTRYSPTLQYEGDLTACNGVGFYTFGALFVGCWDIRGHVVPHGLGALQSSTSTDIMSVDGWFHGLRCAHPCPSDQCTFKLSADLRSQPQPQRGLMLADGKLQYWRRSALTRALSTWTRLCCEFSTAQAKRSRLLALQARAQACLAEQRATIEDLERQKAAKSQDDAELLVLLAKSRDAQEIRTQRRQLYDQRLAGAIKQRDLAGACVAKQDTAVKALEIELQGVIQQLKEARKAQEVCAQYARELQLLKRQIENASVKLNAARFEKQRLEITQREQEPVSILSQRSVPSTPMKKTQEDNGNSSVQSRDGIKYRSEQFVCDVPDCQCGIPRDVFLRVSAVLNNE